VATERRHFDVGIVVPLREEFRYLLEIAPLLESISHEGTYFYRLDFGAISAVCCVMDQMGPLPALHAAIRLLEFADLKLLAMLGVAGALDDDIALGDVVVAAEINEFQANSKAESIDGGYEVRYSGRHWPLDFRIREALTHFEFAGGDSFNRWQKATSDHYSDLEIPDKIDGGCRCSMHLGPIASGNIVAASSVFAEEIKRINRKFVAIDMEAAGMASAAGERIHPLPCLISDRADEKKKMLDAQGKKTWRRYAVRNAAAFLAGLLKWDGFLKAVGLDKSTTSPGNQNVASGLANHLKSCVGGPWLVGVIFGVYCHGPGMVDGEVLPVDLSRLRVSDATIRALLKAAEKVKEEFIADSNLLKAAEHFAGLIETFRDQFNSPKMISVLKGFDQVVLAVLCPEDDNQQIESVLLQAEKLEEEVGTDAVIGFLKEFVSFHPLIRERYIDALATLKKWPEITQVVGKVELTDLSRLELEHGFSAYAETGLADCAKALIKQHQSAYDDKPATIFRREVSRRYSDIEYHESGDET
jgi:nucleoside phosphorylase